MMLRPLPLPPLQVSTEIAMYCYFLPAHDVLRAWHARLSGESRAGSAARARWPIAAASALVVALALAQVGTIGLGELMLRKTGLVDRVAVRKSILYVEARVRPVSGMTPEAPASSLRSQVR